MKKKTVPIFLSIFTFLFYLLIIELLMQGYNQYLNIRYGKTNAETFLHEYDPSRGWKNKNNSSGEFIVKNDRIKSQISINSKGLRGPEYDYAKAEGTKRVLILGDSMAAGFEVSEHETVRAQLENKLRTHGPWQVINAGTRGYGTDQSFLFLTQEGFQYQPDFVVYLFADNDLENNVSIYTKGKQYGKPYFVIDQTGGLHSSGIPVSRSFNRDRTVMSHPAAQEYFDQITRSENTIPLDKKSNLTDAVKSIKKFLFEHSLLYKFVALQLKKVPAVQDSLFRLGITRFGITPPRPKEMLEAEWQIMEKILLEMKRHSETINAKFVIFEVVNGFKTSQPSAELEAISNKHNFSLIRSYQSFIEASQTQKFKLRCKDYIHWTAQGHALAASLIYQFFINQKWL